MTDPQLDFLFHEVHKKLKNTEYKVPTQREFRTFCNSIDLNNIEITDVKNLTNVLVGYIIKMFNKINEDKNEKETTGNDQ